MKNKHQSRCSFAPKRTKWLYTANSKASPLETEFSNLGENDFNLYLCILQTQGVTWNTLSSKAHQYITLLIKVQSNGVDFDIYNYGQSRGL